MKGETISELTGFAKVMRQKAATIENGTDAIDISGEQAAIWQIRLTFPQPHLCGCRRGSKVAKHGNRSVSSKVGSADVLEQLGVKTFHLLRNRQLLVWTNVESVFCLHKNFTAL